MHCIIKATAITASVFLVFFAPILDAGEAVLRTDTNLYQTADTGAKITASLKTGTRVEILGRKSAWYQVKYGPILQGWLPLQSLRLTVGKGFTGYIKHLPKPAPAGGEGEEGEEGAGTPAITIRALSNQSFTDVEPDEEAVKALEKYAVDKKQANDFASELGLKTHTVEYLVKAENEEEAAPKKEQGKEESEEEF